MRVLAIDPALRNTGYAVLERLDGGGGSRLPQQEKYRALTYGVIHNPAKMRQPACLVAIRSQLAEVICKYEPEVCAVEAVIYVQSFKTAIIMGAARGAALIAAAEQGMEVFEYAPKRVKQAVVGTGSASKDQVAFMMRALLGLTETPSSDEADAMAIGMTYFYTESTRAMLGQSVSLV